MFGEVVRWIIWFGRLGCELGVELWVEVVFVGGGELDRF